MSERIVHDADHAVNLLSKLCLNDEYADVTFLIDGQRLPAHRLILASSNEYFRGLLFGGFAESKTNEIELDVKLEPFKAILKYIYTGTIELPAYTEDDSIIDLLKLAHEYDLENVVSKLSPKVCELLNTTNMVKMLTSAHLYNMNSIYNQCLEFIDKNALAFMNQKSYMTLSKELFGEILSRSTFPIIEVDIFHAVMAWGEIHDREDFKFVLSKVRFTLMQIDQLNTIVRPTNVLEANVLDELISQIKNLGKELPYRNGETHRNKLICYELATGNGQIRGSLPYKAKNGLLFKLPRVQLMNFIELELLESFNNGYYIEISCDQRIWTRIIDYTIYKCHSKQHLYFEIQRVLYIYIESKNRLYIKDLKTDYRFLTVPMLVDGLIAPTFSRELESSCHNCHHASSINSNSNESLFIDIVRTTSNVLKKHFCQPLYINCIKVSNPYNGIFPKIYRLEMKFRDEPFKQIEFQAVQDGNNYLFEAKAISYMRIKFNSNNNNEFNMNFFYHPGSRLNLVYNIK